MPDFLRRDEFIRKTALHEAVRFAGDRTTVIDHVLTTAKRFEAYISGDDAKDRT